GHRKRDGRTVWSRECLVARQFAESLVQLVGNGLVLLLFVNQFVCKVEINKHRSINTAKTKRVSSQKLKATEVRREVERRRRVLLNYYY
ncbi:hypothetical protein CGJ15_27065, partial [Vibrio parahaemolyticus]